MTLCIRVPFDLPSAYGLPMLRKKSCAGTLLDGMAPLLRSANIVGPPIVSGEQKTGVAEFVPEVVTVQGGLIGGRNQFASCHSFEKLMV